MTRRWRYRCRTCGEELESWAAAERHGDAHHGARLELLGIGKSSESPGPVTPLTRFLRIESELWRTDGDR